MPELAARRANVRETIAALRAYPDYSALWLRCLRSALYDYRCAQNG